MNNLFFKPRSSSASPFLMSISNLFHFYTTPNVIIVSQPACMYGNYSDLISDYNFSFHFYTTPKVNTVSRSLWVGQNNSRFKTLSLFPLNLLLPMLAF